ncbi:hypothetical protein WMY93_010376 [Mugilogobius chulae]|uniref:Transposase n=1 Tax=Mugilogobius chulae TaxID=88201 RepID=A0AAW0PAU9_9GOBI
MQCGRCEYRNKWSSQPMVRNTPAGNLQLCAAVLFAGSSFRKIYQFLNAFSVQSLSEQCYHKHQAKLLFPTIHCHWKTEQEALIKESIAGGPVTLGGDMRADSPGHSAKYGSYSMMDVKRNKILDFQLVQSNEVGNSVRMEKEGFRRCLSFLEQRGLDVQAVVTDRHTGVQKFLRDERPHITHYFDPWHMGKGIGKKRELLSKQRGLQDVGLWTKSVVNHFYWSATTATSGEEAVAKWSAVANHIQNVHTHDNALFPHCLHEPLVGERARHWLKPSTAACERLTTILLAPRFMKDIASLYCCWSAYPKYKRGEYTVRPIKTKPTLAYVDKLMTLLFDCVVEDPLLYQTTFESIPVPESLCAQFHRPEKQEAASRHRSRFF